MGRIRRGGYIIESFIGDHRPRHVHIFDSKGRFLGRLDSVKMIGIEGWIPARKLLQTVQQLKDEDPRTHEVLHCLGQQIAAARSAWEGEAGSAGVYTNILKNRKVWDCASSQEVRYRSLLNRSDFQNASICVGNPTGPLTLISWLSTSFLSRALGSGHFPGPFFQFPSQIHHITRP